MISYESSHGTPVFHYKRVLGVLIILIRASPKVASPSKRGEEEEVNPDLTAGGIGTSHLASSPARPPRLVKGVVGLVKGRASQMEC